MQVERRLHDTVLSKKISMETLIISSWMFLGMIVFILILKLLLPTVSWIRHFVLFILCSVAVYYAFTFILAEAYENNHNFWPIFYCVLCCGLIYKGGRSLDYLTRTGIFDRITNKPVGHFGPGSLKFIVPFLEYTSIKTDGQENIGISMKATEIKIPETPKIQTLTKGVQAVVKDIVFLIKPTDKIELLYPIYEGPKTIANRIISFVYQFFQDKIGHIDPEVLDQNKGDAVRKLAKELKAEVIKFCEENQFPFTIPETAVVTIGDTELDKEYYAALARKAIAVLTQNALDVDADALKDRLVRVGNALLKGTHYTDADKLQAAQISLGIVKKDIQFKKFGVDPDFGKLIKAIAMLLKKK
jgi:hypothetical protein